MRWGPMAGKASFGEVAVTVRRIILELSFGAGRISR